MKVNAQAGHLPGHSVYVHQPDLAAGDSRALINPPLKTIRAALPYVVSALSFFAYREVGHDGLFILGLIPIVCAVLASDAYALSQRLKKF